MHSSQCYTMIVFPSVAETQHVYQLVHWCSAAAAAAVAVTGQWTYRCLQPTTSDVIPSWWPRTAGRRPVGCRTCEAALTARCTAVVDRPWTWAVLSCRQRRGRLPGTRNWWCWTGWRCSPPSYVASWTCTSTGRLTLNSWTPTVLVLTTQMIGPTVWNSPKSQG